MFSLEAFDPRQATDDVLRPLAEITRSVEREHVPDVLVPPVEYEIAEWRDQPRFSDLAGWVALDGGEPVGHAWCLWNDLPDNRHHAQFEIEVVKHARHQGVGHSLLARVTDHARARGCTLLDCEARLEAGTGPDFLRRFGFEARLTSPRNVLLTSRIDPARLHEWVDRASERAAGYELTWWDHRSDDLLDEYLDLWQVMNTAPFEDFEHDPEVMTRERHEAAVASREARGIEAWTLIARERDSGTAVGFTTIMLPTTWPTYAEQWDTGVRPEHRNRGLGRWLKAAMALRLIDERPRVAVVETFNAGSNRPMLAINEAMGYRPEEWWAEWQAELSTVRTALGDTTRGGGRRNGYRAANG